LEKSCKTAAAFVGSVHG